MRVLTIDSQERWLREIIRNFHLPTKTHNQTLEAPQHKFTVYVQIFEGHKFHCFVVNLSYPQNLHPLKILYVYNVECCNHDHDHDHDDDMMMMMYDCID